MIANAMYVIVKAAVKFGFKAFSAYPTATALLLTLSFIAIKHGVMPTIITGAYFGISDLRHRSQGAVNESNGLDRIRCFGRLAI